MPGDTIYNVTVGGVDPKVIETMATQLEQMMNKLSDVATDVQTILDTDAEIKAAVTVKLTALQKTVEDQAAIIATMTSEKAEEQAQIDALKVNADAAVLATSDLLKIVAPASPAS